MKPWVYSLLYKIGAPWEIGVRPELRELVESRRITPERHPRVLDFGCGSGCNDVFLAQHGFRVTGVDFTPIALNRAYRNVAEGGVGTECQIRFGDVTDPKLLRDEGPFDLLLDFGTLDDLKPDDRLAMADNVHRLTRPGAVFVMWCFYGDKRDLPLLKFNGVSRLHAVVEPGEETKLFGDAFDIERLPEPAPETHISCFFMTRR